MARAPSGESVGFDGSMIRLKMSASTARLIAKSYATERSTAIRFPACSRPRQPHALSPAHRLERVRCHLEQVRPRLAVAVPRHLQVRLERQEPAVPAVPRVLQ